MTMKKIATQFALGISLIAGMSSTSIAQTPTSALRGTVLDPSGALIPNAQVTVTAADGSARSLKSDDAGSFEVSNLAPGSHSVSVEATGFTPSLEGVELKAGSVAQENIQLGISVAQVIEVSADDDAVPAAQ
jgi:hypothetical protein